MKTETHFSHNPCHQSHHGRSVHAGRFYDKCVVVFMVVGEAIAYDGKDNDR
jgi:hypothetical protein